MKENILQKINHHAPNAPLGHFLNLNQVIVQFAQREALLPKDLDFVQFALLELIPKIKNLENVLHALQEHIQKVERQDALLAPLEVMQKLVQKCAQFAQEELFLKRKNQENALYAQLELILIVIQLNV